MVLVAGATGFQGGEICRLLAKEGEAVRGMVLSTSEPETTNRLKEPGIVLAQTDLKDPGSLGKRAQGQTPRFLPLPPFEAVETVDHAVLRQRKAGATNPMEETFAGLMISYAHGDEIDVQDTRRICGVDPISVREYAQSVLSAEA